MDQDTDWIACEFDDPNDQPNLKFVILSVLSAIKNTPDGKNVTKIIDVEKVIIDEKKIWKYKYQRKQTEKNLINIFKGKQQYTLEEKIKFIEQLANGVFTYYKYQLFHGNLHPENIFIDTQTQELTLGHSLACSIQRVEEYGKEVDIPIPITSPTIYDAPELTGKEKRSPKSDAYSFGVIVMQILTDFKIDSLKKLEEHIAKDAADIEKYLVTKDLLQLVNESPGQRLPVKIIPQSLFKKQKNQGQQIQQVRPAQQNLNEVSINQPYHTPTAEGMNPSESQQAQQLQEQSMLQNESDEDFDLNQQSQRDEYYSRISTKTIQVSQQQQIYLSKAKEVNIIHSSLEKPLQQLEKDKQTMIDIQSSIQDPNKLRVHHIILILIEYAQVEIIINEEIKNIQQLPIIQAQISDLKSKLFSASNISLSLYMKTVVLRQSLEEDTSFANLNKWFSYFKSLY